MEKTMSTSDASSPISPTVSSGFTAVASSTYDEEAASEKDGPSALLADFNVALHLLTTAVAKSWWARWRQPAASSPDSAPSQRTITRTVEHSPNGYPMVANFQCSDRNFLHYRGFLDLHSRLLLDCQYDIELLEKELDKLDQWDKDSGIVARLRCLECKERDRKQSVFENMSDEFKQLGFTRTRPEVMADLNAKLMNYDEILLKAKAINALQKPSNRDHRSVVNWFEARRPIVEEEASFIYRKEDLVALGNVRECGGFDGLVEKFLSALDRVFQKMNCNIIKKLFVSPELRDKTTDERLHYYSPARVDMLVNLIVTAIIFVLLVLPVIVLYKLSNGTSPFEAIGILIIFTLVFGAAMSSLTTATRQELFAASAAYCAVLVVFISNFLTQTVRIA